MSQNDRDTLLDNDLPCDPRLARLYQVASSDEPPGELDAAILAAARRSVQAGPVAIGGGQMASPPLRAKRNWYVPVSIAAVLVLSVSLVTLVYEEKGGELAQPPMATGPRASAPAPAAVPANEVAAVLSEKSDANLNDAMPAKAAPAATVAVENAARAPVAANDPAKKQRAEKPEVMAERVPSGDARRDQATSTLPREQGPATSALDKQRAEPFPAARESEAKAMAAPPPPVTVPAPGAVASAIPAPLQESSVEAARARSEADSSAKPARRAVQQAPAATDSVAASPAARQAAGSVGSSAIGVRGFDGGTLSAAKEAPAPVSAAGRVEDRALSASPRSATVPPAKPALASQTAPLWRGLEDQPPEKWLERLAEFRRDNRKDDADMLLVEFRRRFPDHPAAAR